MERRSDTGNRSSNFDTCKQILFLAKCLKRVTQVTEDLDSSIILKVIELIKLLTGRPPRDAAHIAEVKYTLEHFPHQNLDGAVNQQDHENRVGTVPMDSDIWGKLLDWRHLTQAQQTETKEFLLMKFGIDDLELALDQYVRQNGGQVPTTLQYRIFINNWRGNKTKRRTQSLDEMKMALEQKEDEIYQERDYNNVLHSQLGFVTHVNSGQLMYLQNLVQENETRLRDLQNLEQENETLRGNNKQLEKDVKQKSHITDQLRSTITRKDRQIRRKEYQSVIRKQLLKIKKKEDEIKAQSAKINEQSTKINEQSAKINEQSTKINEQSTKINEQSTKINEQSGKINEQSTKINEQSANINELSEQNGSQRKAIDNLNNRIDLEVHVKKEQKEINVEQNEKLRKNKIDDENLRKQLVEKDRINQELHDQLKDVNMLYK
ncbi:unnamed protein product [Mytilus coruscus]|uniref:Uncharacterized protein n=1 Tax=Mytilus coruscus TaxID=42192 RepID=A0A6J8BUS7_MYTCO|nr:unnamed protein product [Mytilus coruscus]